MKSLLVMPILAAASISTASFGATVDWKPTFNDKPVSPGSIENVEKALPSEPIVMPQAKRRVLVYSATAGYRHGSIAIGKIAVEKLGAATGAYESVVSDDPANFEPEALKGFDSVILLNTTQDFFMPTAKNERKKFSDDEWAALQERNNRLIDNLIDYVEQGGGLVGIHAATDSCYKHKEYGETMGAYFAGHPWTAGHTVTIVVEDGEHGIIKPVFGEMKDFSLKDEIYQFKDEPYSRERLRVLLHLDPVRSDEPKSKPKRADNDYAVSWVQKVGKGRVFYTSLGHRDDIYWNPLMLNHYLAGIQFALGDLPADTTPSAKLAMPNVERTSGEWASLFDGKTLNGWTQRDGKAKYSVRNGVVLGTSVLATPNSFLCTDKTYGDFELEFDVKCGAINSGVQIRSKETKPDGSQRVNGPQVEIEQSPGQAGYIYGEAYANWRSPEPKSKDPKVNAHDAFKNDDWNHYRIVAKGARIQTWINGKAIADLTDEESYKLYPNGFIGLQVHSHRKGGVEVEWRNIRIRDL